MAGKEPCFAWFVVFCSFMLHLITDGVAYTFGIFFTALLEDLHSSKAMAAWIPSIMTGLTYGVGPLAAALTDHYGCRVIALTGTTLTALGFAVASFAGGVFALYGSIGVLAGAGFGLIYLPAVVCLTQHFSRHLALATGLAVSASGIGTALFAPLTEQLIQRFGWRSAMRFVSIVLLFSGSFALSFGSPIKSNQSTPEDSAVVEEDNDSHKKMVHFGASKKCSIDSLKEQNVPLTKSNGQVGLRLDVEKANRLNQLLSNQQVIQTSPAAIHFDGNQSNDAKHNELEPLSPDSSFLQTPPVLSNNVSFNQMHHQSHSNLSHSLRQSAHHHNRTSMYKSHGNLHSHHGTGSGKQETSLLTAPIVPLDSILLYSTSLTSINFCADSHAKSIESHNHSRRTSAHTNPMSSSLNESNKSRRQSITSSIHSPGNQFVNPLTSSNHTSTVHHPPLSSSVADSETSNQNTCGTLRALLKFGLLRDLLFIWFALSNFLTSLGYYVPHIYIKERCLVLDEPVVAEHCSYLLSLIGVSSTVGRILFGFISDFEGCNRIMLYSHCLLLCGLATAFTPLAYNYWWLGLFCIVFGLTTGAFVSLTTVILVDLLGVAKLTNAFGLLLLFQGVASLTGPPIIGLMYDLTKSYHEGFVFAGVAIAISGFMLYFTSIIRKKSTVIKLIN